MRRLLPVLFAIAASALAQETRTGDSVKVRALYAPTPSYPLAVRKEHKGGAGIFILHMDTSTGLVKSVSTKQSTGVPLLDKSCKQTFLRWRFPAHQVAPAIVMPIAFRPLESTE